jgi:hypothetical protein
MVGSAACVGAGEESSQVEDVGVVSQRIEGGYGDTGDAAVVGLAVVDEDGYLMRTCSGVLIAPNLVLTAQHCVAVTAEFESCAAARFGSPVDPAQLYVTQDASMWAQDTRWLSAVDVAVSPGAEGVCGRDLATIVLSGRVDDVAKPIQPRVVEAVESWEVYSAIGFGASEGDGDDAGIRRRRDDLTVLCVGPACSTPEVDGREWRGNHGVCNGDSGGPAVDANGHVIGITSRGPSGCDDPIYGGLVAHRDWITGEATYAARLASYEPPEWAGGIPVGDQSAASDVGDPRWQGCSYAPGGATSSAFALVIVAALVAAGLRRQRL